MPVSPDKTTIVRRAELPELRSVVVDGDEHDIGLLLDFTRHPDIREFVPPAARLAMSWARLERGQELEPHVHPIRSMIVIAEGSGVTESGEEFGPGDILLTPDGVRHGYVGTGADGFWALAIQFEVRGLYEDPDAALVAFRAEGGDPTSVEALLERNDQLERAYRSSRVFRLLASGRLDDPARRERLLAACQVLSDRFQQVLFARSALTEEPRFARLFRQHLDEEAGHDQVLAADRAVGDLPWDPVLDAGASWFLAKVLGLDDAARLVLVHLVLEASSDAFSAAATAALGDGPGARYLGAHVRADGEHRRMGLDLLAPTPEGAAHLAEVQRQGWRMITMVCDRMAELADPEVP